MIPPTEFLTTQLITYLGNKRKLLGFIAPEVEKIRQHLGKDRLVILDGFAGSGACARLFKGFATELHVNDLEGYAETVNRAFLTNPSTLDMARLEGYIEILNARRIPPSTTAPRFIEKNYTPKDDSNIQPGERVFFTNRNGKIIDHLRKLIDMVPQPYRELCLAALLVKASSHNNTSGVFKGFHKKNGIGHFGGAGENALARIKKEITLDTPVLFEAPCASKIHRCDTNQLVLSKDLPEFDLAYYDPPYNQHPYGSNYFMLNIINDGSPVPIQDGVSGIAEKWNKSEYNRRRHAALALDDLLANTRAKFVMISYNNEGIIPLSDFEKILDKHGTWSLRRQDYSAYKGSRNLRSRRAKVEELLWILEKS